MSSMSLYSNISLPQHMLNKKIIIWDNDGTIMGSKDPHDTTSQAKVIMPNVERVMRETDALHIICSGCATPESELQNFDPDMIIAKLAALMDKLPICAATSSPAIGGTQCYVIIKKPGDTTLIVRNAHEDPRYQHLIGQFKKPGNGMLVVIRDMILEEFGITVTPENSIMIGDTWHDEHAAATMSIPFLDAAIIHNILSK